MALARERNAKIFACLVKCYLVFKCLRENRLVLGLKALSELKTPRFKFKWDLNMIQAYGVQSITPRCNDTPRRVAAWR